MQAKKYHVYLRSVNGKISRRWLWLSEAQTVVIVNQYRLYKPEVVIATLVAI